MKTEKQINKEEFNSYVVFVVLIGCLFVPWLLDEIKWYYCLGINALNLMVIGGIFNTSKNWSKDTKSNHK